MIHSKANPTPRTKAQCRASALVTTLMVLVVLSVIVVAFMQSMAVERRVAQSYANIERARLAAEAGARLAASQVASLFIDYPDSATGWFTLAGGSGTNAVTNSFTAYFFRRQAATNVGTMPGATNAAIYVLPLFSGAQPQPQASANLTNLSTLPISPTNFYNFNRQGSIGTPPGQTNFPPMQGAWVEILQNPDAPRNLERDGNGRHINPPVARYAFWVDDESFRVNIDLAENTPRDRLTQGQEPSQIVLSQWASAVTTGAATNTLANNLISLRNLLPEGAWMAALQKRHVTGFPTNTASAGIADFTTTIHSSALNYSRGGVKRLNLNEVVIDSEDPATIRAQLDRIIAAIRNERAMPRFGQRFFREGTTAAQLNNDSFVPRTVQAGYAISFEDIYLEKLAANIRDYLDSDSQPTIIRNNAARSVAIGAKPLVAPGFGAVGNGPAATDTLAIGKERVPALGEAAFRATLYSLEPPSNTNGGAGSNYDFALDYYFKLWNPTNEDITLADLGPNPFLRIYNQIGWDSSGGTDVPPGRPFEIPLSGFEDQNGNPFRIPAGTMVVLTTDNAPSAVLPMVNRLVFRPNAATAATILNQRRFTGITRRRANESDSVWPSNSCYRINPTLGSSGGRAGTANSDYDTHMLIGNDLGILEGFTALAFPVNMSVNNDTGTRLGPNNENFFFRGGSLRGNTSGTGSTTGDYATINEQLHVLRYSGSFDDNGQTRFFSNGLNNNSNPANSAFGAFNRNSTYVQPIYWPDYTSEVFTAARAPRVIRNGPMDSIGELGHVYDPARLPGASNDLAGSRGGGLTLRIGQPNLATAYVAGSAAQQARQRLGRWDGNQTNNSRNWTAWRLVDVFSTNSEEQLPGRININGVTRDNGFAFSSIFGGYRYTPSTPTNMALAGSSVTSDRILNTSVTTTGSGLGLLITDMRNRVGTNLATANLFWERGEFSELNRFNTNNTAFVGVNVYTAEDRGREELFRRSVELITTKGSVFTVYAAGQSVTVNNSGQVMPGATKVKKITFRLDPVYQNALPEDSTFDPSVTGSNDPQNRFRPPDHYAITILSESDV